jgi:hypothetical protein
MSVTPGARENMTPTGTPMMSLGNAPARAQEDVGQAWSSRARGGERLDRISRAMKRSTSAMALHLPSPRWNL